MTRVSRNLTSQSGITVVELLVVCVVIAIVASIALLGGGSSREQLNRQNAATLLKVGFERARIDSVKRRADAGGSPAIPLAYVRVDSATQFTLVTDFNSDGDLLDPQDTAVFTLPAGINIEPRSGLSFPVTVAFNRRGEPSIADPSFVVCNGTCTFDNDTSANANIVDVSATGTVAILAGGSAIANFAAPNVSTVPTNTTIRSQTYIAP